MSNGIFDQWTSSFGTALPAGFLLRSARPEIWLRVHSLPESKRYPENQADYQEVLRRYNSVATDVLGEGSLCTLFITRFGENQVWSKRDEMPLGNKTPQHVFGHGLDDDAIQFFALSVCWRANNFDELLTSVANDQTGPILFSNLAKQTAFSPYDGGADLFFQSECERNTAKTVFAPWLSERQDGL